MNEQEAYTKAFDAGADWQLQRITQYLEKFLSDINDTPLKENEIQGELKLDMRGFPV